MDTTTPEARFLWSGRRASSAIVHPTISLRSLDPVEDHFFNFRDTAVASTCNVFQSQIPPPLPPRWYQVRFSTSTSSLLQLFFAGSVLPCLHSPALSVVAWTGLHLPNWSVLTPWLVCMHPNCVSPRWSCNCLTLFCTFPPPVTRDVVADGH